MTVVLVVLALAIVLSTATYLDARRRDWTGRWYGTPDWTIFTFLFGVPGFVVYLVRRTRRT